MFRSVVMPAPNAPLEIQTSPRPQVEQGGVLLKTLAAEVCGTDVHLWHGRLAGVPYPLIPGHVSVGEVLETGGPVRDVEGTDVLPGDVVTFLDVHETCGNCWYCLVAQATTRCPSRKVYGITYRARDGLLGGWSEAIMLKPGVKILKLAAGVGVDAFIGGGCGLPTAVHAVQLAGIQLGDRVLVQGSGPVGLSVCALARLSGAGWVGVTGAPALRLKTAEQFGADWTADVTDTSPEARRREVQALCGGVGPDVVIEASGNPAAVSEGCSLVRDAGRYVIVGQYTDAGSVEINPHTQINRKHLEIRGCWGSDFRHVWRAMQILQRFGGQFDWSGMISKRYALESVQTALEDVAAQRVVKAVILPNG
jgi:L-iditol 2-dehydrogenase